MEGAHMESKTVQQKNSYFTEDGFVIITPICIPANTETDTSEQIEEKICHVLDEWKVIPWFKYIQENATFVINSRYDTRFDFSTPIVSERIYKLRWKLTKKQHTVFMLAYGDEWKKCTIRRFR